MRALVGAACLSLGWGVPAVAQTRAVLPVRAEVVQATPSIIGLAIAQAAARDTSQLATIIGGLGDLIQVEVLESQRTEPHLSDVGLGSMTQRASLRPRHAQGPAVVGPVVGGSAVVRIVTLHYLRN